MMPYKKYLKMSIVINFTDVKKESTLTPDDDEKNEINIGG